MIQTLFRSANDVEAMRQAVVAEHPIARLAAPEEVGSVIAILASDDAAYLTGLAIPVDGALDPVRTHFSE